MTEKKFLIIEKYESKIDADRNKENKIVLTIFIKWILFFSSFKKTINGTAKRQRVY